MDIPTQKSKLRKNMKELRKKLSADNPDAENMIVENLPGELLNSKANLVAGYLPIGSELDPTLATLRMTYDRRGLCLPRLDPISNKLEFFAWNYGDEVETGPYSLTQPKGDSARVYPDFLFVPLLAFDRQGHRLGYGKGHYDQAISSLPTRPCLCGIGFSGQEVLTLPAEQHDQKLDWVITEKEAIFIQSK